ncbi:aldolase/citrate lyase family protein [soil metagenome]
MATTLSPDDLAKTLAYLAPGQDALAKRYPGESGKRQPVHTVYGGGHLFKADTAPKLGVLAKKSLAEFAPNAFVFARAIGLPGHEHLPKAVNDARITLAELEKNPSGVKAANPHAWFAHTVYTRVVAKLEREPVEDFRIDFEDGYGNRPDAEEDGHVEAAARELAKGAKEGTLPPFIGIRVKPYTRELAARSIRTLDIFLTTLVEASGGKLPAGFVVTFPKIQFPEQVTAFVDVLDTLEAKLGLANGSVQIEIMVEQTQTIFTEDGKSALPLLHDAARGRLTGAHFGTYDYTASCSITAAHQHMTHPACDFARHMMQVAFGGTGVFLSDGATNVMPVGPHRVKGETKLSREEELENRAAVHRAWHLHTAHIRHSLEHAFYQGWDLHPAQLPTRYAAIITFFLEGLPPATERLKNFVDKAAQATLVGDVFDDAATGQGLLNFFLRGLSCGALTEAEALATGLTVDEYRSRSFVKILENRRKR